MTRLARAADLIGRPVVGLDTAAVVGEIKDVLIDPARSLVIGFTLRGRGLLSPALLGMLPAEEVRSLGRDAVMIESEAVLLRQREGMESMVGDQDEVIGKKVVSDTGQPLGTVADVVLEVDGAKAVVVGYEIEGSDGQRLLVPVPGTVPLSAGALVVPAGAEENVAGGLSSFREALERARRPASEASA